jgi:hypothetical protein
MTITRKIQDRIDRLTAKPGAMLQLDIWPESQRVIPNSLARCALFTAAGKKEPRQVFTQERIASLTDMAVYYTGTELRQDDLDVWMQVVHMTRKKPAGDWIETSGSALLSALVSRGLRLAFTTPVQTLGVKVPAGDTVRCRRVDHAALSEQEKLWPGSVTSALRSAANASVSACRGSQAKCRSVGSEFAV